jgi:hypothetical protein
MIKRAGKYCLILLAFVAAACNVKAQAREEVVIDTIKHLISYDGSRISFDTSIANKTWWVQVLSKDTALISFFRKERKTSQFTLHISKIEMLLSAPFTYRFRVFWSPVLPEGRDAAKQLMGLGYAYYHIKLLPAPQKTYAIAEITFLGLEI